MISGECRVNLGIRCSRQAYRTFKTVFLQIVFSLTVFFKTVFFQIVLFLTVLFQTVFGMISCEGRVNLGIRCSRQAYRAS